MSTMSSGPGIGGANISPVPLQRDLETTAWTEYNKAALGITADSLEKSFTQMNPRYTSGYYGGYKSSEDQPLLDHPLESGRISQGFDAGSDDSWKETYDALFNQLPEGLQQNLMTEGKKNFDDRKGSFAALDNLLVLTAKILTSTNKLAGIEEMGPLQYERALMTQVLPFTALREVAGQGANITEKALAFIILQGPNNYFFDTFTNLLTQMGNGVKDLQQLANEIKQEGISDQITQRATRLASHLTKINESFEIANLGGSLQILLSTMHAMTAVASSLSLFTTGAGSLFLGLTIASIGIKTDDSQTGILGNSLGHVFETLSNGLISSLIPNATAAGSRLLEMSLTTGFTALIGLAALVITPGIGVFPGKDLITVKSSRFFAFELALLLLNSSGVLRGLITPFLQASGANDKSINTANHILSQLANLLLISAGTRDGRQNPAYLCESISKYLEKGISASHDAINATGINQEILGEEILDQNEGASKQKIDATNVALQQAQIALNEKNYEGFIDSFVNMLEDLGTTSEDFFKDIDTINKQTRSIFNTSFKDSDSEQTTTVVHFI